MFWFVVVSTDNNINTNDSGSESMAVSSSNLDKFHVDHVQYPPKKRRKLTKTQTRKDGAATANGAIVSCMFSRFTCVIVWFSSRWN